MSPKSKARSDVGLKRGGNEDAFLTDDALGFYAVADGMGGHAAGEVASGLALQAASDAFRRGLRAGVEDALQLARMAGRAAVQSVFRAAEADAKLSGMGTTLTVLVLRSEAGALAHVGDSRAYRLRDGAVERLSTDHTIATELVRLGFGDEAAARRSPYGHNLSRSVGRHLDVEIELREVQQRPGDRYLLCTDGLTDHLDRDEDLVDDLMADFDAIPDGLVDFANAAGGDDNITVVVIELPDELTSTSTPMSGLLAMDIEAS